MIRFIAIIALLAAAICVPIVFVAHHSLMPDSAQLAQIDTAVQSAAPQGLELRRLRAPDRIESQGDTKFGYFTYETVRPPIERYLAEWRITGGKVELTSLKRL